MMMCRELWEFILREYTFAKSVQVGMCVYVANIALRMSIGIYVVVYDEYIKIRYNDKSEPPILINPIRISSSLLHSLVGDDRIELPTSCL